MKQSYYEPLDYTDPLIMGPLVLSVCAVGLAICNSIIIYGAYKKYKAVEKNFGFFGLLGAKNK